MSFDPSPSDTALAHETQRVTAALRHELEERDDVMALVAHELRNPLHVLSLQLSVARLSAQSDPQQAGTLARIEKAQHTLDRYTARVTVLLDLVSARGGDYPSRPVELDVVSLLRGLVDSLTTEARFRGVELMLDAPAACVAVLDPLILEQIIDNLLLNALKHAACTRVVLSLKDDGRGGLQLGVTDNGRGVSAEDREHIFGKFDVARGSDRGTGTGLGLWIVRKLSLALGGSITLESPAEGGCSFVLRCPLSSPFAKPSP